jgi:hypothetical protein
MLVYSYIIEIIVLVNIIAYIEEFEGKQGTSHNFLVTGQISVYTFFIYNYLNVS